MNRPPNYRKPISGGNYFRPPNGSSRIRIVSPEFIQGNVAWEDLQDGNQRPVRRPYGEIIPGKVRDHKSFWAMAVYDYADKRIKIWEITQVGIQKELDELMENPDWEDLNSFDLQIKREGEGLKTKYGVTPCPKSAMSDEVRKAVEETPVNLEALILGDDPFVYDGIPYGNTANVVDAK